MNWSAAVIGLVVFHRRTRDHIVRVDPAMPRAQQDRSATVVVSVTPEGTLRIHSTTGPGSREPTVDTHPRRW